MVFLIWKTNPATKQIWTYITPILEFNDFNIAGFFCKPKIKRMTKYYEAKAFDLNGLIIHSHRFRGTLEECQKYVQEYCDKMEEKYKPKESFVL